MPRILALSIVRQEDCLKFEACTPSTSGKSFVSNFGSMTFWPTHRSKSGDAPAASLRHISHRSE